MSEETQEPEVEDSRDACARLDANNDAKGLISHTNAHTSNQPSTSQLLQRLDRFPSRSRLLSELRQLLFAIHLELLILPLNLPLNVLFHCH